MTKIVLNVGSQLADLQAALDRTFAENWAAKRGEVNLWYSQIDLMTGMKSLVVPPDVRLSFDWTYHEPNDGSGVLRCFQTLYWFRSHE
jgi:hypothetical protein